MPQLDKVTFLSQFFWLCLFYLGFYYLVLKYFLPKISRILTLRQKKTNFTHSELLSLQVENQQVRENLDRILFRGISLSRTVFNDFLFRTMSWLDLSLKDGNKTHYKKANNSYLVSLGDASLSQNIKLYHASTHLPENLRGREVIDKIKNFRKAAISVSPKLRQEQDQALLKKQTTTVQEKNKKSKNNKK